MNIQDNITDADIERLLEESKNWYGYIPKGFISDKLKSFFKDLEVENDRRKHSKDLNKHQGKTLRGF